MLLGFGGGIAFNPMLLAGAAAIVAATQLRSPGGQAAADPDADPVADRAGEGRVLA